MSFILSMQYRLTPLSGRRHPRPKLMHNREFELALIFLKIRACVHPNLQETYEYWRDQYKQIERHNHNERRPHHHQRQTFHHPQDELEDEE